jgi:serine/threonine-protein kinase
MSTTKRKQATHTSTRDGVHRLSHGTIVGARFRVQRKLAAGAMGEVWLGEHDSLKLRVALKVLKPDALQNDEIVKRFAREAYLLGQIQSDHVARVIDFVNETKYGPVLVMELVEGTSLADVLAEKRMTVEEAIELGIDLGSALRELHVADVVHRDVKPSNVLIRTLRDGTKRAVFVDLGVSRHVPSEEETPDDGLTAITTVNRAVGTLEYMAPEQIVNSRQVTPSADIYSLGAVLFRAVSGQNVFGDLRGMALARARLSEESPRLDTGRTDPIAHEFELLVSRALAPSLEERFESAEAMLAALRSLRDRARRIERERQPPARRARGAHGADSTTPAAMTTSLASGIEASTPSTRPERRLLSPEWRSRIASSVLGMTAGAVVGVLVGGRLPSPPPHAHGPRVDGERCTLIAHRGDAGAPAEVSVVCDEPIQISGAP